MYSVEDDDISQAYLKALVYGKPGTGKTNIGTSAPNPLILLSERQAVANVRDAAKRLGRPRPPILVMETLDDYRYVLRALHGDRAKPFVVAKDDGTVILTLAKWPETIVIDSVTDVMEMISTEIREQSPPKLGKDNLPVDSERFWNVMEDKGRKFVRAFRDAPAHVVFLALFAERGPKDAEDKTQPWAGPQMGMRKLETAIMAAVNVVGITYRRRSDKVDEKTKQREMAYGIATTGPDHMCLKPYRPLRDHEVPDFSSWVSRINGVDDGTSAPPPMDGDAPTAPAAVASAAGDVEAPPPAAVKAADAPAEAKPAEPVTEAKPADAKPDTKTTKAKKDAPAAA